MHKMHPRLRTQRRLRLKRKANARYKRKHPSHRMKHGHNFVMNEIYDKSNPVCLKCGRNR